MKKILTNTLLTTMVLSLFIQTAFAISFSDTENDIHKEAITYLENNNIINGYPDGTFQPNRTLNRAELLKLAVLATHANGKFDYPTFAAYHNCFPDVKDEWFASYVCFAKSHGWVQGYSDGKFHPEKEVNKVEAIKMITQVNELTTDKDTTLNFKDILQNAWYFQYLQIAASHNLLEETGDYFFPEKGMTRGSTAEVLYRLITGKSSASAPPTNSNPLSGIGQCEPLHTVVGTTITVNDTDELQFAVEQANKNDNTTILLKDGTYSFNEKGLWISGSNIIIRSESGNRDQVILKGAGMNGKTTHIFSIAGDNISIGDLSLGEVANHAIQVHGELDADGTILHNLHITNAYEQLVKVSYDPGNMGTRSDGGLLECSTLEYTAGIGPQYYIGGIDAHNAANWTVRDNMFSSISSPEDQLAEDAVHFWSDSQNTLVENNFFLNCDRAIGFGMGEDRGANGGTISFNKIYHNSTRGDAGIILESANDVVILSNIILMENDYPNAIEYRYKGTTGVEIIGNITNKIIKQRDGAQATIQDNITDAKISDYNDPANGDFTKKT